MPQIHLDHRDLDLDCCTIFALMMFPDDPGKRMTILREFGIQRSTTVPTLGIHLQPLASPLAEGFKQGENAGKILTILKAGDKQSLNLSVRKAITLLGGRWNKAEASNGTTTARTFQNHWGRMKPVAHLHAAAILLNDIQRRKEVGLLGNADWEFCLNGDFRLWLLHQDVPNHERAFFLELFATLADGFRLFGETFKDEKASSPLFDVGNTWTFPPDYAAMFSDHSAPLLLDKALDGVSIVENVLRMKMDAHPQDSQTWNNPAKPRRRSNKRKR